MSVEERLAVLETEVHDGFTNVADRLDRVVHSVDAVKDEMRGGFHEMNGRVKKQELESATQRGALRVLMWLGGVPAIILGIIGLVVAIRGM